MVLRLLAQLNEILNHYGNILGLAGVILGLAGAWLSFKGIKLARESEKALSTQYLGQFPDYLPKVHEVIHNTKHSLKILACVPSHGSFSKADKWISIENVLKELEFKDIPCKAVLLYTELNGRRMNYETQHSGLVDPKHWDRYKTSHKRLIRSFLNNGAALEDLTLPQWIEHRLQHDEDVIRNVYRHFVKYPGKTIYPMFCWIGDNEAVFSLKAEDNEAHYMAAGFYTRDGHILETLRLTFQFYLDEYTASLKKSSTPI